MVEVMVMMMVLMAVVVMLVLMVVVVIIMLLAVGVVRLDDAYVPTQQNKYIHNYTQ